MVLHRASMRFSTRTLGAATLAACLALLVASNTSLPAAAPQAGPLVSRLATARDWPPPFQANEPEFPPALTPAQELATFHMPPGYQVQLVAAEPLVQDPILAEFDGNGRLWV